LLHSDFKTKQYIQWRNNEVGKVQGGRVLGKKLTNLQIVGCELHKNAMSQQKTPLIVKK